MSETLRVETARLPEGLVPLQATVGGRVQTIQLLSGSPESQRFVYQWPGTYFEAAFRGQALYFSTGDGRQGLHLVVDHQPPVAFVSSGPTSYRVAGLAPGSHTVRLEVVSEGQAGPEQFGGFMVPSKGRLSPVQAGPRQIEFIGDSYTVGYGNTSGKTSCSKEEIWSTTDDSAAFGPVMAEHFGAEYQVNAISGRGVVRNYNGGKSDTLPTVYPFVLFDKQQRYEDPSWKPQVIVIGLGTNDFTTALHAGEPWTTREALHADYESKYVQFVNGLRARNPSALLILWATEGAQGEIQAEVEKVAKRLKAGGETRVEYVPINRLQMSGCDSHPSVADDRTIAARLSALIEAHPEVWQGLPGKASSKR